MIRKEMIYQRGFVLVRGVRRPRMKVTYFREKWENDQGYGGIEFTQALYEARVFRTYKHARAMMCRLIDAGIPTTVAKVVDERRILARRREGVNR